MFKVIVLFSIVALSCALHEDYETVCTNDEEVVTGAKLAAKDLSKRFNGKFHLKLAKVITAGKHHLSSGGWLFTMRIIVGETSCTKDEYTYENIDECAFQTGIDHFLNCRAEIHRNAEGKYILAGSGCRDAKKDEV